MQTIEIAKSQPTIASSFHLSSVQFAASFRAWLYLVAVMTIGRFVWYFELRDRLPNSVEVSDWSAAILHGLRQDFSASGYFLLPAIVCGMIVSVIPRIDRITTLVREISMAVPLVITPVLFYCSVGYYEAFADVFGAMLFEAFEGNAGLVVGEAVNDYRLVERLLLAAIGGALAIAGYRLVCRKFNMATLIRLLEGTSWRRKVVTSVVVPAFVFFAIRGSLISRPLQKIDSSVTNSIILNRGAINPYIALRYAVAEHLQSREHKTKEYDPDVTYSLVRQWQGKLTNGHIELATQASVDSEIDKSAINFRLPMLQRSAKGTNKVKPSHIFLIFLESYDSWPMLDEFSELAIVEDGKKLASEGLLLKTFLPAANSSVVSYLACLQGLQESNRFAVENPPTCLVDNLKKLGYQTREINGFPADWCRIREASERLGFDEVYCVEDILPGGETSNRWLHDRTLYDFARNMPYEKQTFNVIRSSSNHGPWEVDIEQEKCAIEDLPAEIQGHPIADDKRKVVYSHAKYADMMMVKFVRDMIKRFPQALFVITGDHYGRNYPTHFPGIYHRSSVPLILYGPEVLEGASFPTDAAGSHLDIGPTITELCAPAGFTYLALGKNLLDPASQKHGIGTDFVIFPDCIVSLTEPASVEALPWKTTTTQIPVEAIETAKQLHMLYHGLGFHLSSKPNGDQKRR